MNKKHKKRINTWLDPDIYWAIKRESYKTKVSMNDLISEVLRKKYIESKGK
jgi:predicted HicB family RNase H-like nuclease